MEWTDSNVDFLIHYEIKAKEIRSLEGREDKRDGAMKLNTPS